MTTTWTAETYWNTVLGANRTAADVVREFELDQSDRRGLDEWLANAEIEAASAGARGDIVERDAMIEAWAPLHAGALDQLCAVTDAPKAAPKKLLTITMSERRPLKIDPELWLVVAEASRHDGKVKSQANNEWAINVREHADGRRIVYGYHQAGNGGQYAGFRERRAGYLVDNVRRNDLPMREDRDGNMTAVHPNEDETIRAIRRVGGVIDDDQLAAECIADLPAETI